MTYAGKRKKGEEKKREEKKKKKRKVMTYATQTSLASRLSSKLHIARHRTLLQPTYLDYYYGPTCTLLHSGARSGFFSGFLGLWKDVKEASWRYWKNIWRYWNTDIFGHSAKKMLRIKRCWKFEWGIKLVDLLVNYSRVFPSCSLRKKLHEFHWN